MLDSHGISPVQFKVQDLSLPYCQDIWSIYLKDMIKLHSMKKSKCIELVKKLEGSQLVETYSFKLKPKPDKKNSKSKPKVKLTDELVNGTFSSFSLHDDFHINNRGFDSLQSQ